MNFFTKNFIQMNKHICIYIFFSVLITIFSCKDAGKKTTSLTDTIPVRVHRLKSVKMSLPVRTSGKLFSKTEVRLSFKTGGLIRSIYTDEGKSVKKGQILAQLYLSEIQSRVNKAKQGLEKARRDFHRAKNLYEDTVATLEQFQNAQTALEVAESNLHIARFNLRHSYIRAPADGKILKKLAAENEMTAPGHPVFLFGSSEKEWIVRVNVTDKDIVKLNLNDTAEILLDAYPEKCLKARVTETGEFADPYTGTFEVELTLYNTDIRLISGLICTAMIYPSEKQSWFKVPYSALVSGEGNRAVIYIAKGNTFSKSTIKVIKQPDFMLAKSGLKENMLIITKGQNELKKNSKILIKY